MDPLTYRAAGVDIRAGDEVVRRIGPLAASTLRPEVLGGLGAFAAFCRNSPRATAASCASIAPKYIASVSA